MYSTAPDNRFNRSYEQMGGFRFTCWREMPSDGYRWGIAVEYDTAKFFVSL